MAHNLYVQLSANGEAITGDVSFANFGGIDVSSDHIEAHGFYHELTATTSTDTRGSYPVYGPVTFIKRIDRATPLLMRSWANGHSVNAVMKFFGNASSIHEGSEVVLEHVYQLEQGRIVAIRTEMLNNRAAETGAMPVLERVTLTYRTLRVIHPPSSLEWLGSGAVKQ